MVKGLMSYCLSHQYYKMVTLKSCYDYVVKDYQKNIFIMNSLEILKNFFSDFLKIPQQPNFHKSQIAMLTI